MWIGDYLCQAKKKKKKGKRIKYTRNSKYILHLSAMMWELGIGYFFPPLAGSPMGFFSDLTGPHSEPVRASGVKNYKNVARSH